MEVPRSCKAAAVPGLGRRRAGIGGHDWLGSTTKPKAMLSGGSCWFPSQAAARGANNARIMAEARTHIRRGMGFMGVR